MSFLDNVREMEDEHQAWLRFCDELKERGLDINEEDRIHAAVTLWGERLVALRFKQETEVVTKARQEATDRFRSVTGEDVP